MGLYLDQLKAKKDLNRPVNGPTKPTKPIKGGSVGSIGSMTAHLETFFHNDDTTEVLNHLEKNDRHDVCVTDPDEKDITSGQGTDLQNLQNHPGAAGQVLDIEPMQWCLNDKPCRHLDASGDDRPRCKIGGPVFDMPACPLGLWGNRGQITMLSARLAELIKAGENSKGWTPEQVQTWMDEGEAISKRLPRSVVETVFRTA